MPTAVLDRSTPAAFARRARHSLLTEHVSGFTEFLAVLRTLIGATGIELEQIVIVFSLLGLLMFQDRELHVNYLMYFRLVHHEHRRLLIGIVQAQARSVVVNGELLLRCAND